MAPSVYLDSPPSVPEGFSLVDGYRFYCVNRIGTVLSCRTRGGKFIAWNAMVPHLDKKNHGRLHVGFRSDGKLVSKWVHRLVLETFVSARPVGMEACHNDGNPLNNSVTNLRWDTHKANLKDRDKHGTSPIGVRNGSAILTEEQVREIRRLYRNGMRQNQIAPSFGVSKQCVQTVCSGTNWATVV